MKGLYAESPRPKLPGRMATGVRQVSEGSFDEGNFDTEVLRFITI